MVDEVSLSSVYPTSDNQHDNLGLQARYIPPSLKGHGDGPGEGSKNIVSCRA